MGSFSAYNLTLNGPLFLQFLQSYNFYNSYLAYEVVFHPSIFRYFPTEWMLKNPKGSPFQFFWPCETFFSILFS